MNSIDKYCLERIEVRKKDSASHNTALTSGFQYISSEIRNRYNELNNEAIVEVGILEGFLVTFLAYCSDKEALKRVEAIIG